MARTTKGKFIKICKLKANVFWNVSKRNSDYLSQSQNVEVLSSFPIYFNLPFSQCWLKHLQNKTLQWRVQKEKVQVSKFESQKWKFSSKTILFAQHGKKKKKDKQQQQNPITKQTKTPKLYFWGKRHTLLFDSVAQIQHVEVQIWYRALFDKLRD